MAWGRPGLNEFSARWKHLPCGGTIQVCQRLTEPLEIALIAPMHSDERLEAPVHSERVALCRNADCGKSWDAEIFLGCRDPEIIGEVVLLPCDPDRLRGLRLLHRYDFQTLGIWTHRASHITGAPCVGGIYVDRVADNVLCLGVDCVQSWSASMLRTWAPEKWRLVGLYNDRPAPIPLGAIEMLGVTGRQTLLAALRATANGQRNSLRRSLVALAREDLERRLPRSMIEGVTDEEIERSLLREVRAAELCRDIEARARSLLREVHAAESRRQVLRDHRPDSITSREANEQTVRDGEAAYRSDPLAPPAEIDFESGRGNRHERESERAAVRESTTLDGMALQARAGANISPPAHATETDRVLAAIDATLAEHADGIEDDEEDGA